MQAVRYTSAMQPEKLGTDGAVSVIYESARKMQDAEKIAKRHNMGIVALHDILRLYENFDNSSIDSSEQLRFRFFLVDKPNSLSPGHYERDGNTMKQVHHRQYKVLLPWKKIIVRNENVGTPLGYLCRQELYGPLMVIGYTDQSPESHHGAHRVVAVPRKFELVSPDDIIEAIRATGDATKMADHGIWPPRIRD